DEPEHAVRVLPSVLAYAGEVPLDVARVLHGLVEGRGEEADDPGLVVDEPLLGGGEGLLHLRVVARPGDHGPRLRDGVDLALGTLGRAQRRAVVVVGAAEPGAVPAGVVEALAEPRPVRPVARGPLGLPPRLAERE